MRRRIYSRGCNSRAPVLLLLATLAMTMPAHGALSVSAIASVDTARRNELMNIEFMVANSDAFSRTGVVVTMTYPANVNSLFETEFDGDCPSTSCSAGETVTWIIGAIPAGGAVSVELPVSVTSAAPDSAIISFDPTVTDDAAASDSANATVVVDIAASYDLGLAERSDPATAASDLSYTLVYGRRADAGSVANTQLTFVVPAGATFVSASDGGTLDAGTVEWPLGFMSPGESGVREVTVALGAGLDAGTALSATAEIANLTTPSQRSGAGAITAIATSIPFGLAIEPVIDSLRISELANLQLTVTNNAPFTRFGVTLRGRYPQGFNQVFESMFAGNCASTSCSAGERIVWTLGDIPAGGSVVVDLPPQLASTELSGTIRDLHASVFDDQGASARQSRSLRVQADLIYDLALVENADPVLPDTHLTYKLTFGYRADAGGVAESTLVFPLPEGTSFVSATGDGTLNSGVVEWPLGFLSPGARGLREVVVQVDSALVAGTILEAVAEIRAVANVHDRVRAESNTVVATDVPLEIAIETNPNPTRTPELSNFQLTVTNNAAFTRFGVQLQGRFPQNVNQTFEAEFDGDCASTSCSQGERITWLLGNIPAGGATTVDLPASVASSVTGGTLINLFAWARDDQGFETRQADTTSVSTVTPYDLSLTESADPATAGAGLDYMLSWSYRADAGAVTNTVLRLPLPAGTSLVAADDGAVLVGDVIEWDLGFVQPGAGGVRTARLLIDPDTLGGEVIEAHADISSVAAPDTTLRAEANTTVLAEVPLQLYIETNPNPSRTNELVNHQLTVSNNSAFTRFGVELTARYPASANQSFEAEFGGNCASTSCSSGERISWPLGDLPAGGTRTVDLPYVVFSGATGGTLINLYAQASDDLGEQTLALDTVRIQPDTVYDLGLAEASDPVAAGSSLSYELTYGYRADAALVTDTTLRFRVPAGTSYLSSSPGGFLSGEFVIWPVGTLFPGDGDVQLVTVQADAGLAQGSVLTASAQLMTTSGAIENARSEANTIIDSGAPLSLQIVPNRNNVEAGLLLELLLSVTNNDPLPRFGVDLYARYPQSTDALSETLFAGDCSSTTCTAGERVRWALGTIPAGETATVSLPINVSGAVPDGLVMETFAWAEDDQKEQTRDVESALFGCANSIDADCDAISDTADNCTNRANFSQRDTDEDDIGNACDPDIAPATNDCSVNFLDLSAMKATFFLAPSDPAWNPDADFNGDNAVNFGDLSTMRSLFFGPPGPSASGCN